MLLARSSDSFVLRGPWATTVGRSDFGRSGWRRSLSARGRWMFIRSRSRRACGCPRRAAARAACGGVPDDGRGLVDVVVTGSRRIGVTQVAMEATGVYWQPVWAILEDDFECVLVNARHVKQVPGRKTDVVDAAWLCQLTEAGLLRASFVPPKLDRRVAESDPVSQDADRGASREANSPAQSARRTPGSSSTASRRTSSARPGGRCSTRS